MRWSHLLLAAALPLLAQSPPSYRGLVRLPADIEAGNGKPLARGSYVAEVQQKEGSYWLRFLKGKESKLNVRGEPGADSAAAGVPVIGSQFLRSSEDPLPPGQDRQFSKTGASQYEEEKRDWKGVLRLYESEDEKEAWFLFQERAAGGTWTTIKFPVKLRK